MSHCSCTNYLRTTELSFYNWLHTFMSSMLSAQLHHHTNLCSVRKASAIISWSGPGRFIYADTPRPVSNDICIIGGPCRGSIRVVGAPHGGWAMSSSVSHLLFAGLPNLTSSPTSVTGKPQELPQYLTQILFCTDNVRTGKESLPRPVFFICECRVYDTYFSLVYVWP